MSLAEKQTNSVPPCTCKNASRHIGGSYDVASQSLHWAAAARAVASGVYTVYEESLPVAGIVSWRAELR
jgi:hypothetical protein